MKRPHMFPALVATAALMLAGCSTGSADEKDTSEATTEVRADAFPVTIEHKFGETTIEDEPKRVVTVGWTDQDNALALGVVPVGATKLTWGGNDAGSSDWFDAKLEEVGGEAPVRYDDADGIPFAELAKLDPDVILATNSGLTKKDYDKLTGMAPVVAYPEAPWVTPWQTQMEMVGKALGRTALAEDVIAETEKKVEEATADYSQIKGKSLIFGYLATTDLSVIGMYAPEDPRVSLMHDFGMVDAPSVAKSIKPGEFYGQVSAEDASTLESDVFLTWSEAPSDMETFTEHNLIGQIPAIEGGHFYAEEDKHVSLAVTNPSPISIPYVIEHFIPHVAEAVDGS
ncbi:MAG: iron-siderophore ABC transporter substrate-binding protein [Nocardioides sp.]|nr:iron-siderophore ABC transporter substrate-binding protein [Nocardioides sp.]